MPAQELSASGTTHCTNDKGRDGIPDAPSGSGDFPYLRHAHAEGITNINRSERSQRGQVLMLIMVAMVVIRRPWRSAATWDFYNTKKPRFRRPRTVRR
jgi:hypothetical protein